MMINAPKLPTRKTFIKVSRNENISSKVSSFKMTNLFLVNNCFLIRSLLNLLSDIVGFYLANIVLYRFFSFWILRKLAELLTAKHFSFYLTHRKMRKKPSISNRTFILFIFAFYITNLRKHKISNYGKFRCNRNHFNSCGRFIIIWW
jgi:hypothetical protein